MRANVLSVQAGTDLPHQEAHEQSLELERDALRYAESLLETNPSDGTYAAHLIARSSNNISDDLRQLGRCKEALPHAMRACELWPENDGMAMNLVVTLFRAGHKNEADQLLRRIMDSTDFNSARSVVRSYALFDDEFRVELAELPTAKHLRERVGG